MSVQHLGWVHLCPAHPILLLPEPNCRLTRAVTLGEMSESSQTQVAASSEPAGKGSREDHSQVRPNNHTQRNKPNHLYSQKLQ